jgi:transposase
MWYAGIDWSDRHHEVVVIDAVGKRVGKRQVDHTVEGLAELIAFLKSIGDIAQHPGHLACIIETNQGLLITTLLEAGLPVYPVNPKTLEKMRKPSGAKTDAIDAQLLARKGRSDLDDLRRLTPDSPLNQELKALTRDQDGLIQAQTRLVNQITACLKAYYPVALTLFGKVHQPVTVAFLLAYPTLDAVQAASTEELVALLQSARHPHPEQKAREIGDKVHQRQLHADPVTTRTKSRLLLALVKQLQPVIEAIAAYDEEITRLFLTHPDSAIFSGLPGAGERLAPRLLAEWGDDRQRYLDATSIQALAGTSPVTFQSGNFCKAHRRTACVKPFRNALHQFAWHSTQQELWAATYYQRKRDEGKSHPVALRALANQWVRIIYALWRKQQPYDAAIFVAAQQAHAPRAA